MTKDEPPRHDSLFALHGLADVLKGLERNRAAFAEQILKGAQISERISRDFREQLERNRRAIIEPALKAAVFVRDQIQQALPANWHDLDGDQFAALLDLAESGELCLVWAPRHEIVVEVLDAATHDDRDAVLRAHCEDVLDDVLSLLDDAAATAVPAQDQARDLVREAVAAAQSGFDRAAQALLASALGLILEGILGFERLGAAYKAYKDTDPEDAVIADLRLVCIQLTTANALVDTEHSPDGFNRHGTQHGDFDFLGEADMLAGALLTAAWIRELSWIAEHQPPGSAA
jgi:hypothetical protein